MFYHPELDDSTDLDSKVVRVKATHEQRLMSIKGVVGVGVGSDEIGDDAIILYLLDASVRQRIPARIEGVPVVTEITGEIDAL